MTHSPIPTSEQTPLLRSPNGHGSESHYERFSPRQKKFILALVSWTGLLPFFVAGSFIPLIPQISRDLNSTGPIVSLAVSLSIFATAIGSMSLATYSGYYGRRPVYLCGLPLLCLGSLGVALSRTIPELMAWRILQAFGSSGGLAIGTGVIGDIYKLDERGSAMGIFFAACLVGPALAPLAGGLAAYYSSWRAMQSILFLYGLSAFVLIYAFFPETSRPKARRVDKSNETVEAPVERRKWVWLNPFKALYLLRSPNLIFITLAGTFVLLTDYVLLVPLAYTIGVRYHITNEALIGACFLPMGLGNLIGAPLAGRMSDHVVAAWREKRDGKWVPEDRLRASLWGAAVLVPISILISGITTQYVEGTVGLVINLVCLFVNGLGVDVVLTPSAAYFVDIMHSQSAEVMSSNTGFRSILIAISTAGVLPLIDLIGVAATNAAAAILAWIGFFMLWCVIRYGEEMRAWVDVGYSTEEDN